MLINVKNIVLLSERDRGTPWLKKWPRQACSLPWSMSALLLTWRLPIILDIIIVYCHTKVLYHLSIMLWCLNVLYYAVSFIPLGMSVREKWKGNSKKKKRVIHYIKIQSGQHQCYNMFIYKCMVETMKRLRCCCSSLLRKRKKKSCQSKACATIL